MVTVVLFGSKTHLVGLNLSRSLSFVYDLFLHYVYDSGSSLLRPLGLSNGFTTPNKSRGLPWTLCSLSSLTLWRVGTKSEDTRTDVPRGTGGSHKLDCPPKRNSHPSVDKSTIPSPSTTRVPSRLPRTCIVGRNFEGHRETLRDRDRLVTRSSFTATEGIP